MKDNTLSKLKTTLKSKTMNQTIAIAESKNSDRIKVFCTGVNELLKYCSMQQAKKIQNAKNEGTLYGVWFTKTGKVRAQYI